ncbi:hypothetical protein [Deinococcus apachensis]|uniref:hypothetical protein n=1 Tax=Deinococcus apachensis TaxID=309886 RepID=UPI00058BF4EF|nr:hypothetical protein [Deinococcus apachensis]
MTLTAPTLIRWSGLAALVAGLYFAAIQPIHPPDVLASVTTTAWAVITPLKTVMCLLFLLGLVGLYTRQLHKVGWLGLAGYLLLSLFWALQTALIFTEAFILPPLATVAPKFVDGVLGVVSGHPTGMNLGALPLLFVLAAIPYVFGGLLFGIATFRAGILPRGAAGLLAVAAALTPLAALLPHSIQRLAGMPVGLALAWLGYALWSERRESAAALQLDPGKPQLQRT